MPDDPAKFAAILALVGVVLGAAVSGIVQVATSLWTLHRQRQQLAAEWANREREWRRDRLAAALEELLAEVDPDVHPTPSAARITSLVARVSLMLDGSKLHGELNHWMVQTASKLTGYHGPLPDKAEHLHLIGKLFEAARKVLVPNTAGAPAPPPH